MPSASRHGAGGRATARRITIIGRASGWHAGRIAEAARQRGHEVAHVAWDALASSIHADGESFAPAALATAGVVCVRGMPGGGAGPDRLEQVVFRMDLLGRLAAAGTPVINAPRALEAAIDKYLASSRIAAAGVAVPRTMVVHGPVAAGEAWELLGRDCVVKPLFGSQGKGLVRIDSEASLRAWRAGADGPGPESVCYLQEFVGHAGWDARILLVGDRAFAMRRRVPPGEWRANLAVGGRAEPFTPPHEWELAARRAAAALGVEVAGVDLLPATDGSPLVLEVNAVPGWRGLEAATGVDVTAAVLDHLEQVAADRP